MSANDGGPAFPHGHVSELTGHFVNGYGGEGMSLRAWLSGQALCGAVASYAGMPLAEAATLVAQAGGPEAFAAIVGKAAVMYADATLLALEAK